MARLYARFILRILKHKWWVLYFGIRVGGIPIWRLLIHDYTKFYRAEFIPKFRVQILKEPQGKEWERALDHHHSRNPHHWQYWVKDDIASPIPETYVREMIADWIAADKTYNVGLAPWLRKDFPGMKFHPDTQMRVVELLESQGIAKESYWPRSDCAA